ncbi:MAG: diphosphate--fructose-6-phosphate 1-phosphotransferase [candidate division WOR-3 bacterium]|nr:diphosphate--fructose-6-phosphate 1-phosphotransferase [candidate division WOR-3 bacterium]
MKRETLAIVVGGGPAPGINGVISSVTIEAINLGKKVIGIEDGFKWLSRGISDRTLPLTVSDVSRIHTSGGSILGTSRENPGGDSQKMANVVDILKKVGVTYLVTIGGDDTAFTASEVAKAVGGKIRVAHVPKTIDNDLPLPDNMPTFGFETARHVGTKIVENLMEDAKTIARWYFVTTMGREAGHLALGIGKAAGATLVIIAEEFSKSKHIQLSTIADILEGAVIKRRAMGRNDGVAVIAEGIAEKIGKDELESLAELERDEHGHIRLSEIDIGKFLKNEVKKRLRKRGIDMTIINTNVGYEVRSATPIPFDVEYTRNLGYGAVKFLFSGGSNAIIAYRSGKLTPIPFSEIVNSKTGRTRVRFVDINSESYEVAKAYMIRLKKQDFDDRENLERLARAGNVSSEEFENRFRHIAI